MTTEHIWHHAYKSAILETDWTKIQERLQVAESEIRKRQHVLSMDHGGTPEERQAIADALNGMKALRAEVAQWQTQQSRGGEATLRLSHLRMPHSEGFRNDDKLE